MHRSGRNHARSWVAALLASTVLAGAAHAQTVTWTGAAADGDWLNDANWSTLLQPAPGETALFTGAAPAPFAVTITGGSVDIATMRFDATSPRHTFTVDGSFMVFSGAGGLGIVNDGAANSPILNLVNGSQLIFSNATGAGNATINLDQSGIGFDNTASAQNATITINNFGAAFFLDNSTAGNAFISVTNTSELVFIDNSTGGDARIFVDATSMVDFSGTLGPGNNGQVSVGSLEGFGLVGIGAFNTLSVGSNNLNTELNGVLADDCGCGGPGPGSMRKVGTGTFIMSGANTYTGSTTVEQGTLIVNSTIATSSGLVVDALGTVGGIGSLPSTVINGTLAPGNSIGTITVQGTLAVSATGSYLVEVSPTTADRTNVTTTATLGGTLRLRPTGGTYTVGQQYVILNAALGRSGEFGTLDVSTGFGAVRPRIVYDNNNVIVVLDANAITPSLPPSTGGNAGGAAAAIDRILATGGGDAFAGLFNLPPSALPAALSQLTGEIGTTGPMLWFEAMRMFLNAMTDPYAGFGGGGGGPGGGFASFAPEQPALPEAAQAFASIGKAPAMVDRRWTVWGAAFGSQSTANGDPSAGSNNASARNGNIAVGADYKIAPDTRIGFAVSGGSGSFNVSGLGSGRGDTYQVGLYGSTRLYDFYLTAAGAYAWADASTDRTVSVGGVAGRLTADYRAEAIGGRIEAGRRFAFGAHGITPFAALLAEAARTPAYSERAAAGAGAFALSYGGDTAHRTRSEIGIGLDTRMSVAGVDSLGLFARAAWAHEFSRDRSITAAFQVLPTASFTVRGASAAADAAVITGGLDLALTRSVTVRGKVEGEFADGASTYSATGALRVTW